MLTDARKPGFLGVAAIVVRHLQGAIAARHDTALGEVVRAVRLDARLDRAAADEDAAVSVGLASAADDLVDAVRQVAVMDADAPAVFRPAGVERVVLAATNGQETHHNCPARTASRHWSCAIV